MKPPVEQVLVGLAGTLGTEVIPHVSEGYAVGHVAASAMLGIFVAQEFDRAAENHELSIEAMQGLFRAFLAEHGAVPAALGQEVRAMAHAPLASRRVSALAAQREAMLTALIALQEAAEADPSPSGRARERAILTLLLDDAERRALFIPPMG
jgi:hypothetical protein